MLKDILNNIQFEQAILLMAPPGWGKTYRLLEALKKTKRKAVFVFPLRALCDEVYLAALKKRVNVCNIGAKKDLFILNEVSFDLILTTPECLSLDAIEYLVQNYMFILDEVHLFNNWGKSFRPKMLEALECLTSYSVPLILLSATMNESSKNFYQNYLKLHYIDFYSIDFGNLTLKNLPTQIYYYSSSKKKWLIDELRINKKKM